MAKKQKASFAAFFKAQKHLQAMILTSGHTFNKTPSGLSATDHINSIGADIAETYARKKKRIVNKFSATNELGHVILDANGIPFIKKADMDDFDEAIYKMNDELFEFEQLIIDATGSNCLEPFVKFKRGEKAQEEFESMEESFKRQKSKTATPKSDIVGPREPDRK